MICSNIIIIKTYYKINKIYYEILPNKINKLNQNKDFKIYMIYQNKMRQILECCHPKKKVILLKTIKIQT